MVSLVTMTVAGAEEAPAVPLDTPSPAATPETRTVSIFYYPWYGTPERDEGWRHWEQGGMAPPESVGANFYPLRGAYSSSDPVVLDTHMHEIAAAGIDTAVISWWGAESFENTVIDDVITAAHRNSVAAAVHIEPYGKRTPNSLRNDLDRLYALGVREVYLYNAMNMSSSGVADVLRRFPDITVWVQSGGHDARSGALAAWASAAGAEGIYTYDPYGVRPSDFAGICSSAAQRGLRCAPSVGPGWDATRATRFTFIKNRRNGATYDEYWQAALDAKAHVVSITSYNEWHEGTTIEPARQAACSGPDNFCYQDYGGAYGWNGPASGWAYLNRTRHWTAVAKGRQPLLNERLAVAQGAARTGDTNTFNLIASSPALAGFAR